MQKHQPTRVWIAGGALAALLMTVAGAQIFPPVLRPGTGGRAYTGTSETGDFQAALRNAIANAQRSLPGRDRLIRYRVREITGENGGIQGLNRVQVSIELTDDRGPSDPDSREDADLWVRSLEPILRVSRTRLSRRESMDIDFSVRNQATRALTLRFPTAQQYELELLRGDNVVWRWSDEQTFAQRATNERLEPGRLLTFRERWSPSEVRQVSAVVAGQYTLRAYLTLEGAGRRVVDARPITIVP